jgi:hypothetical protein
MSSENYCNLLNEMLQELSKPIAMKDSRFNTYIHPIVNQLRITNYIKVMKEMNKKCNSNNKI